MNPAERYARLKLLEIAVKRALPAAAEAAEEYRESVRGNSLETDHGTVSIVRRKPVPILDPEGFLAWVKEHRPDELVEHVNPAYEKAFTAALRCVADVVVDENGEVVEFATVRRPRPYLTVKLSEEAKNQASDSLAAHVEAWTPLELSDE